ncbi:MAG TPA: hypothetical protein VGM56_21975 [Byssovorax sp.]
MAIVEARARASVRDALALDDAAVERQRARLAQRSAELAAEPARAPSTLRERLVAEGLLEPRGRLPDAPVDLAPADPPCLPLVGPWRAVPRSTTADEFESLEAMQGGRRRWLA